MRALLLLGLLTACVHVEPLKLDDRVLNVRIVDTQVEAPRAEPSVRMYKASFARPSVQHHLLTSSGIDLRPSLSLLPAGSTGSDLTLNRLIINDVANAGITLGPSSNSSLNFSGSVLACGNASAGLAFCNESGALSLYSGNSRKLSINPNVSFTVTDPFRVSGAGSVTSVHIGLTGDDNSGIWFSANDTIELVTSGTSRMQVTSTGQAIFTMPGNMTFTTPTATFSGNATIPAGSRLGYNGGTSGFVYNGTRVLAENPISGIAGGSGVEETLSGVLTVNSTAQGNGADTTEDNLQTYSLLASSLSANNKALRYTAWGDGVSTTDVTTVKCYFGATVCSTKVLTASQANTWRMSFEVTRTGATTQICSGTLVNGGAASSTAQTNASPGETLSGAVTIKCTGQRTITSTANSVRQLGGVVEFFN